MIGEGTSKGKLVFEMLTNVVSWLLCGLPAAQVSESICRAPYELCLGQELLKAKEFEKQMSICRTLPGYCLIHFFLVFFRFVSLGKVDHVSFASPVRAAPPSLLLCTIPV